MPKKINMIFQAIKNILKVFSKFSRMEINRDKSSAHYSKVMDSLPHIQEIIGSP